VLHTMACLFADGIAMRERDVCMPVVPMFHANAWGFAYAALLAGASLALPCRQIDPDSLATLIEGAGVTMATAVPTVWLDVLDALRSGRLLRERIATLRRIPMGGAAVSEALIAGFAAFGIEVTHCWGMTEISPLGLVNVPKSALDAAEAAASRSAQGLPIPGCAVRLADETGAEKPRDGMTAGELQIRSPWAADGYFDAAAPGNRLQEEAGGTSAFATDEHGRRWLRTGDIATIDGHGYVRLVDRAKDLIKSGGEWISSQALEGRILEHPDILEAAVVSRPDPRWQERPVAFVALRQGRDRNDAELETELHAALAVHFAKWQLPDAVVVLPILPKGNTGKIDKAALRLDAKKR
jgi:fatty-acyl-CoA synthase